jgi:hypothetical protein
VFGTGKEILLSWSLANHFKNNYLRSNMSNIDHFVASSGLSSIERNEGKHHGFLSKVKHLFSHHMKEEDVRIEGNVSGEKILSMSEQEREERRENVQRVIALAEEERERRCKSILYV